MSAQANDSPTLSTAEIKTIEKPKKRETGDNQTNRNSKVSIPEIRIETAEEPNVQIAQHQTEMFGNCLVTQPDIRMDVTDTSADTDDSSEEEAKKEWDWEDGEELEYEFYELDINKAVGTSL